MLVPEQINKIRADVNGYKLSQVLMSAEQLGVFSCIARGKTNLTDIANDLKVSQYKIELLLNVLVGNGFLKKQDGKYNFSDEIVTLNPSHPASQNGYIHYAIEVRNRWLGLSDAFHETNVGTKNFGEITGGDETATRAFMAAMHANAHPQADFIAKEFNFSRRNILDVGAGSGIYSIQVVQQHKTSSALVFDLPNVTPITREYVEKSGVSGRVQISSGNYRESIPEGPFDDLFLFAIIHQEPEELAFNLLKRAYNSLKSSGRLFLTSFFLNDDRTGPPFSLMFAVEMLVMVDGGKAYTHSEIENLLKKSNFLNLERINNIPGPATLYIATK